MANPLQFEPKKVDPRLELENRLARAPIEHAEALLVAYDLLGMAHQKGVLDLLLGAVSSKNAIFGKIAEYAKEPLSTNAIRNGIGMARLLGSLDPELLSGVIESLTPPVKALELGTHEHLQKAPPPPQAKKAPSLWQLAKRLTSEDARRGLDTVTTLLTGFGKAMK